MARNITVTFADGTAHTYQNAPDNITPDQAQARAEKEFGKSVTALDGGRNANTQPEEKGGVLQGLGNLAAGAVRGAGSIGATLLAPIDIASDVMAGKGLSLESNRARRQAMDLGLQELGAQPESLLYQGGKLGGEIAGTMGAGGALANIAGRVPGVAAAAPNLLQAIRTGGMTAGQGGGITNALTRATGGAIAGGVSAGMVEPEQAGAGAAVGGVLPPALQMAGAGGRALGSTIRPFFAKGQEKIAGDVLREFSANPQNALAQLLRASEIVPGSAPITAMASGDTGLAALSRAMQNADPRYAAELAARQTAQNQARTAALEAVAGNTGKIETAKAARDVATGPMRESVLGAAGKVPSESVLSSIDQLIAKPDNAGKLSQQALNEFRNRIAQFTQDGAIDARALYAIRKDINDVLGGKLQGEAGNLRYAASQLSDVKGLIDDAIDMASRRVPGAQPRPTAPMSASREVATFQPSTAVGPARAAEVGPASRGQVGQYFGPGAEEAVGAARPSWRDYLQTYTRESIPINQMEKLDKVMKAIQTGSVDAQGGLILSGAKLNNILKNEGSELTKLLAPDQMDVLRRISADLNASQIAATTGRAVGSNTLQNMAQNQLLTSALGKTMGGSTPVTATLGRLLQLPYGAANKQIQERLGNALLDPREAARLMADPRNRNLLQLLLREPAQLGYRAAPVIAAQ